MPFTYEHPRPSVTVDVVFLAATSSGPRILLIRRAHDPFAGRWALPGGFLDLDEEFETAARRELREETDLDAGRLVPIGTFGTVGRDPRGRTISIAFAAVHAGDPPPPRAGDDADGARWCTLRRLPPLAFDHAAIVRSALAALGERAARADRLAGLMPPRFTMAELRAVHALVTGHAPAARTLAAAVRPTGTRRGRAPLYAARSTR